MQNSDKQDFKTVLLATFELYGKPPPSMQTLAMYYEALSHVDIGDVKAAISVHVRDTDEGKFLPKPSDILRGMQGNKATLAESAWTKVDKAVRTVGPYESVCFDDPLINSVLSDMGSWPNLVNTSGEEYPFKHNEFVKRYSGMITNPPDSHPKRLIGLTENNNVSEGFKAPPPKLIGDKSKAIAVYQAGDNSNRIGISTLPNNLSDIIKQIGE